MNAIVVVDQNWGIGKDGGLLVHLPNELNYYRERTRGKVIVIGRKTLESFPKKKPLPDRINIVITRNETYEAEDCLICHSAAEAEKLLEQYDTKDVFISGGAEIYRTFLDRCDTFYVTKLQAEFEADRHFPNLDGLGLSVTWKSELQEEKGISYQFLKYERV